MTPGYLDETVGCALAAQQSGAEHSVADIRRVAVTVDGWSIGHKDAYIMQHGPGLNAFFIETETFVACYIKREVGNLARMFKQYVAAARRRGIVFVNQALPVKTDACASVARERGNIFAHSTVFQW